jgi:hypothetical protein
LAEVFHGERGSKPDGREPEKQMLLNGSGRGRSAGAVPEVDRSDFDPSYNPSAPIECEVCGFEMRYVAACKILCSNCGYRRDCSDP